VRFNQERKAVAKEAVAVASKEEPAKEVPPNEMKDTKAAGAPKEAKSTSESKPVFSSSSPLDPEEWRSFTLKDAIEVSHNTKVYRFALPDSSSSLNLPVASCLVVKAPQPDGKPAVKPYTPITSSNVTGHFDLVVKTYKDGKVSGYFWNLTPGAQVEMKGPYKKIDYAPNTYKKLGMIAGGTGITPMLQVIEEILRNPQDSTHVTLVFANVSPKDILLKPKLDRFAEAHPKRFKIHYVVEKVSGFDYVDTN
jgi:cytochrome-b5 reductase